MRLNALPIPALALAALCCGGCCVTGERDAAWQAEWDALAARGYGEPVPAVVRAGDLAWGVWVGDGVVLDRSLAGRERTELRRAVMLHEQGHWVVGDRSHGPAWREAVRAAAERCGVDPLLALDGPAWRVVRP